MKFRKPSKMAYQCADDSRFMHVTMLKSFVNTMLCLMNIGTTEITENAEKAMKSV